MDYVPVSPPDITETRLTVLIVEDEFVVRWSAAEFLRERGYIVIEAISVADSISIFDSGVRVDIVFSNDHVAGELSGCDLAEWLDRNHPHVSLLLTSASSNEPDRFPTGANRRFIAQPYDLADMAAAIESMMTD